MSDLEFATTDDGSQVAYRILSTGHTSWLVWLPGLLYSIESIDDDLPYSRLIHGLTEFANVLVVERQGIGASDMADFDGDVYAQWADGIAAVLDEVRVPSAYLASYAVGAGAAAKFGLRYPDRTLGLVLMHIAIGDATAAQERISAVVARNTEVSEQMMSLTTPSRHDDPSFIKWNLEAGQRGASPRTAAKYWDAALAERSGLIDQLPGLAARTLMLHRRDLALQSPTESEELTALIPNATLRVLDGADMIPNAGDVDGLVAEIAEFVTGEHHAPTSDRPIMALLFTDLVDSTRAVAEAGDDRWTAVLDRHDDVVRRTLARHGGDLVKTTGDGVLATFPTASRALSGASDLRSALGEIGLTARMGVHVAEVDVRGDDIAGIGVHLAARVMGRAAAREILVSEAVTHVALGSAHRFEAHGVAELKGIDGAWNLYRLA